MLISIFKKDLSQNFKKTCCKITQSQFFLEQFVKYRGELTCAGMKMVALNFGINSIKTNLHNPPKWLQCISEGEMIKVIVNIILEISVYTKINKATTLGSWDFSDYLQFKLFLWICFWRNVFSWYFLCKKWSQYISKALYFCLLF